MMWTIPKARCIPKIWFCCKTSNLDDFRRTPQQTWGLCRMYESQTHPSQKVSKKSLCQQSSRFRSGFINNVLTGLAESSHLYPWKYEVPWTGVLEVWGVWKQLFPTCHMTIIYHFERCSNLRIDKPVFFSTLSKSAWEISEIFDFF